MVVIGVILLGIWGLLPYISTTQKETILDTFLIVSGWWTYTLQGGQTYEIEMSASHPVTLVLCEYVDTLQGMERSCRGGVQQMIAESTTSFHKSVVSPAKAGTLFMIIPQNDTGLQITITKIS